MSSVYEALVSLHDHVVLELKLYLLNDSKLSKMGGSNLVVRASLWNERDDAICRARVIITAMDIPDKSMASIGASNVFSGI